MLPVSLAEGPQKKKRATGWHGQTAGTQRDVEAGIVEKRRHCRACWESSSPKEGSLEPEVPKAVRPQASEQGACVFGESPSQTKKWWHGGLGSTGTLGDGDAIRG